MDIHKSMDNQRLISIKTWISISITVDLWKSIYGYATDSRTRARRQNSDLSNLNLTLPNLNSKKPTPILGLKVKQAKSAI